MVDRLQLRQGSRDFFSGGPAPAAFLAHGHHFDCFLIAAVAQRVTLEHDQTVVCRCFKDKDDEHRFSMHEQWSGGLPEAFVAYLDHIELHTYSSFAE